MSHQVSNGMAIWHEVALGCKACWLTEGCSHAKGKVTFWQLHGQSCYGVLVWCLGMVSLGTLLCCLEMLSCSLAVLFLKTVCQFKSMCSGFDFGSDNFRDVRRPLKQADKRNPHTKKWTKNAQNDHVMRSPANQLRGTYNQPVKIEVYTEIQE